MAQEDPRGDRRRLDTHQAGGGVVWYTYMADLRPLWLGAKRPNMASCGRLGGRVGPWMVGMWPKGPAGPVGCGWGRSGPPGTSQGSSQVDGVGLGSCFGLQDAPWA